MHSEKSDIRLDIRLTMIEDGSPVILLIFKVAENGFWILQWCRKKSNISQQRNRKTDGKKGPEPKNCAGFYAYSANPRLLSKPKNRIEIDQTPKNRMQEGTKTAKPRQIWGKTKKPTKKSTKTENRRLLRKVFEFLSPMM